MAMKKSVKLGLLVLVMMGLVFTVSCAKKTPAPEQPAAGEEQAVETDQGAQDAAAGEQDAAIGEEDLEAQRAAQARAEAQKMAEQAKAEFVNTTIYFAFDDASLDEAAREKLRDQAKWLLENTGSTVIVEGHADKRGTDEYNLALGSRRAESVKNFLTKVGVPASRLITISYGEEQPAVQGDNEDVYAKNRRVQFRIR